MKFSPPQHHFSLRNNCKHPPDQNTTAQYASILSFENPHFVQQNTVTMAVDQARFPCVSDEINKLTCKTAASKNIARTTKTWIAAWAEWLKARNINLLKTVSEKRESFHIAGGYVGACINQLDICDFLNIPFAQFGACSFGKSTRCMHVGECSTSSFNQFKLSFFTSKCGRIHRYAVVHFQHGHRIETLGAISSFVLTTSTTYGKIPVPKSQGNEWSSSTLALISL